MDLWYLPCERYASRWTDYVSNTGGMFDAKARQLGVKVNVISLGNELHQIKSGVVLDTLTRTKWCFYQIETLLRFIQDGTITDDSVIYIEDFLTFGFEAIPYACHLKGIRPKVYAFWHAQSVDRNDFTFDMRAWMRPIEQSWAYWLTGIFVAHECLKDLMLTANICDSSKIHAVGTVMSRQVLIDRFYPGYAAKDVGSKDPRERVNRVLFTSRLNKEKRPDLFLELARIFKQRHSYEEIHGPKYSQTEFLILTSRKYDNTDWPDGGAANLQICTKKEYFEYLATSKVMVNTARQDFVSYGLLDALAYGCFPLMPDWLTFPSVLKHDSRYLYLNENMEDACDKLERLLARHSQIYYAGEPEPEIYLEFGDFYEGSVLRMLCVMFRE